MSETSETLQKLGVGQSAASRQHRESTCDMASSVTTKALAAGMIALVDPKNGDIHRLYEHRRRWFEFFQAAHQLPDVVVVVTFYKKEGELRTMLCKPVSSMRAGKYLTVWNLDLGGYRRINLDTIVRLSLDTHSGLDLTNVPS